MALPEKNVAQGAASLDEVNQRLAAIQKNFEAIGAGWITGQGSPENVVAGHIGAIFVNELGGTSTTLYVKTTDDGGKTGWIAK